MQLLTSDMRFVAAPMVGQSDLPFRILVQNHGATLAYTQMLYPSRLESDPEYLAFHRRDLSLSPHPVIVQLCGNNADQILRGARKVVDLCDGIDLNLGCPQDHAREGHYGAYLLRENDWALDESIVAALAQGVSVPVSAKMRLSPGGIDSTVAFGQRLKCAGARFLVLHARYASARRRRHGPANLEAVKALVESVDIPVISNGNVRTWADVLANEAYTGARGIMVGETLLGNPCIFENGLLDPVDISLEYLDLCRTYSDTVSLSAIQAHVRHFIEFQCERRSWYSTFKDELSRCSTIDSIESLLQGHVRDWVSGLELGRKSKTNPGVDEALDIGLAGLYSI